ncbi:MAG: hypothetical protein OXG39_11160 [Chloroflexi bacterium]|nr:hypothetical protein [Chloroflexota bacterium]
MPPAFLTTECIEDTEFVQSQVRESQRRGIAEHSLLIGMARDVVAAGAGGVWHLTP